MAVLTLAALDGVRLILRNPQGDYRGLMRRVRAIADMYEVSACETVTSIFEDDRSCAFYEVELNAEMPSDIAFGFADDILTLFRELGGYNGFTAQHRGQQLLHDDPWWPEGDDPDDDGPSAA